MSSWHHGHVGRAEVESFEAADCVKTGASAAARVVVLGGGFAGLISEEPSPHDSGPGPWGPSQQAVSDPATPGRVLGLA